jgi:O-antigen/teichoic acid export membrane protein
MPNVKLAVALATLSITISEVFSLLYLYLVYKKRYSFTLNANRSYFYGAKKIIKLTIPITIIGIILPLSQVIDSFLIVNILKKYLDNAITVYGVFAGVVLTIINLPVSICYGVSATLVPAVSGAKKTIDRQKNIKLGLALTLILSVLAYGVCLTFHKDIIKILFRRLDAEQLDLASRLLKVCCSSIVFLSLLQSINGILIGKGKAYLVLIGMGVGVIIKVVLNLILLKNPKINIFGGAISLIACYFSAVLINLIIVIIKEKVDAVKELTNRKN